MAARVNPPPAEGEAAPADPVAAGLEAMAVEAEAAALPDATDLDVAEAGDPPPPTLSNAQCLMLAGQLVRGTLQTMAKLESPAATMADERMQPVADSLAAVLDKYGIKLQDVAGGYMLELTALGVAAPFAWAVHTGIKAEIAARQKDAPAAPAGEGAAPQPAAHDPQPFAANDPRSVSLDRK